MFRLHGDNIVEVAKTAMKKSVNLREAWEKQLENVRVEVNKYTTVIVIVNSYYMGK
jgi:hypothetical protein